MERERRYNGGKSEGLWCASGEATERSGGSRGALIGTGARPLGTADSQGGFNQRLSDCSPPAYNRLTAREDPGPDLRLNWMLPRVAKPQPNSKPHSNRRDANDAEKTPKLPLCVFRVSAV
jgi:hypothetical protein